MEQAIEILLDAALQLLGIAVTFIIGWVGIKAKDYLKDADNAAQLEQKEKYARIAVYAVEGALKEFDGVSKFKAAKETFLNYANAKGLPLAEDEVDALIESAHTQLRAEGNEIKKIYDERKTDHIQTTLPLEEE